MKHALSYGVTTAGRGGAFMALHYHVPAGQTKVPDPNEAVMTMEENVSWLWRKKKKERN